MINQHRLSRLQLLNWGTFDGYRCFDVPRSGLLLTGPSGSGKSSLLDAMAAILVRPSRLRLNAAAQGTDTGDRERSLLSYVRGAYKRQADAETGEIKTAFLRTGASWSGIALTFRDDEGRITTLVRLFHIARSANDIKDLKSAYVLASEPVDLLTFKEHVANGLDVRSLKRAFSDWDVWSSDAYTTFAARFRRQLGITSEQAQILLHKTQSAKNLTSLDALFREFMLDVPETFELADKTVEQFTELSTAHATVVDARNQVEALRPLRAHQEELARLDGELAEIALLDEHLGPWVMGNQLSHAHTEADATRAAQEQLAQELYAAERDKARAEELQRQAQRALDGAGGAELGTLQELAQGRRDALDKGVAEVDSLRRIAQAEGLSLPTAGAQLDGFAQQVLARRDGIAQELREMRVSIHGAFSTHAEHRRAVTDLERDLAALRQHRSNLDERLLKARALLASRLQVDESGLPFVGELLEVRGEEQQWRGAVERVLGSFARTLVVPDAHYEAAAEIVDEEYLGTRLVYERVRDVDGDAAPPSDPRSLVNKLVLTDGQYRGWLWERLCARYDYLCVGNTGELTRARKAVTSRGQVKHNADSHEKDDRSRVDDRRRWVLGFSTEAKEAELEAQLREASERAEQASREADAQADRQDELKQRSSALQRLEGLTWQQLDLGGLRDAVVHTEQRIEQLRRRQPDIRALETELAQATSDVDTAERLRRGLDLRHEDKRAALRRLQDRIEELTTSIASAAAVPEEVAGALVAAAQETGVSARDEPTLRLVLTQRRSVLEKDRQSRESMASRTMADYRTTWRVVAADWGEDIGYLPEYLEKLRQLEEDRLPEFENRFFDLLQKQARNNVSSLAAMIKGGRREVRRRVDEVNKSLLMTQFSPGGYLQIEVRDRSLPEVEAFTATLQEIVSGSVEAAFEGVEDRDVAERRFELMRDLLQRLRSEDPADRKWRTQCLDTRLHVHFQAHVQDHEGNALDYYTGSGGRSGGERQRLVTFCLAAALRFQLAPEGTAAPVYALVVIDEAFDKADHEFTRAGLEVFHQFGFQLLLATPLKMLQTIEDYVGGVVMVSNTAGNSSQVHQLIYEQAPPEENSGDGAAQPALEPEAQDSLI